MSIRRLCALLNIVIICGMPSWAQPVEPGGALTSMVTDTGQLAPEAIAARKVAVLERLTSLEKTLLPTAESDTTRTTLNELLTTLNTLEEAMRQRSTFLARIDAVPQQLHALETERQRLIAQSPRPVPPATLTLREQYAMELRQAQMAFMALTAQAEADERRLVVISRELEQRATAREDIEQELLQERSKTGAQSQALAVEVLTVKSQVVAATRQALEAEREWLTRRRAIHDAQLTIDRLRVQRLEQALDRLTQALGNSLQHEQEALRGKEARLAQQVERTENPVEALRLTWQQERLAVRQVTTDYQEQRHRLSEVLRTQEQRNTQEKQAQERLVALIDKYADSSIVAQRFALEFARLRRQRVHASSAPVVALEGRLRTLTEAMLLLDERLYAFDMQMEVRLAEVTQALQATSPLQGDTAVPEARQELADLKAALREQQQELTGLLQEISRLGNAHREYRRLLDAGYHFVLTNMFWLRNAEPMSQSSFTELVVGLRSTGQRLSAVAEAEYTQVVQRLSAAPALWLLLLVGLPGVLGSAAWATRRLHAMEAVMQASPPSRTWFAPLASGTLLVLRGALWPGVLGLMLWWRTVFFASGVEPTDLTPALLRGLLESAFVLWLLLVGHALLRRQGWVQWAWLLPDVSRRSLWRLVMLSGLTLWVLLIPQRILLRAPGEGDAVAGSVVLSRVLFLALQVVLLLLVWVMGRRRAALMQGMLEHSAQARGLLVRCRPLLFLALLSGIVTLMSLEILGYDYAARFLWSRTLVSLAIGVGVLGVLRSLGLRASQWVVQTLAARMRPGLSPTSETGQTAGRATPAWGIRLGWHLLCLLLAGGLILASWGISVAWIATAPLTLDIASRLAILTVTVALVVLVIQASKALTDYLLQPRATSWGQPHEVGRKLRTLAPLVQTIIRVGALFVAGLVLLEQMGVATAPLLTGVGIFGLAIGFASQSLIKDVINGLFLLFEDSLSVGDVVVLRGTGGLVEKVTLRTVTLRDLSGNVHIIPNSTIEMVTNMTMGYSYYLFNIPVAYSVDVDIVIAILHELDEELRQDAAYAMDILAPLEVLGLDRFEASAMIVQARVKTRPIQQWRIGREFHRRLKQALDARGIAMPVPHRVLSGWVGPPCMGRPLE